MSQTVAELLRRGRALGLSARDVRSLISHCLGQPPTWLLAHGDETLGPAYFAECLGALDRLAAGEPLPYLLEEGDFAGLALTLSRETLIPRADTEVLLEGALARLPAGPCRVLELGTGSGALALALKARRPEMTVLATDLSAPALAIAQANAARHGLLVEFWESDWYRGLPTECFPVNAILSNPPYIAPEDPDLTPSVARYEPALALFAEDNGLAALQAILTGARTRLKPGGLLGLEHGYRQGPALAARLRAAGYDQVETLNDSAGRPRAIFARQPHG
jgi:protein-(glutamine-N5) methyltransferase, release factor-specific